MQENYQDQIEGRNSVLELLESGKDINKILLQKEKNMALFIKLLQKQEKEKF